MHPFAHDIHLATSAEPFYLMKDSIQIEAPAIARALSFEAPLFLYCAQYPSWSFPWWHCQVIMNFIMGFSGCLYLRVELFDRLMIDLFSAAKRRRNVLRLAVVYIDSA
jgi:hypothetical protein